MRMRAHRTTSSLALRMALTRARVVDVDSLTNLFTNIEGNDMGEAKNLFNMLSLGNVDVLKVSNAIMEFVISGVLVRFLFWAREKQLQETNEARAYEVPPSAIRVHADAQVRRAEPATGETQRTAQPDAFVQGTRTHL